MRIRRRLALASLLKLSGVLDLANLIGRPSLTIFGYHRMTYPGKRTLFNDTVFDAPLPETFRTQLIWLKSHADPVSELDVYYAVLGRLKLPRRAIMITFDDGYRDNYDLAFPILRDLKIKALFFIPTQAIDERRLGWWDQISWCLNSSRLHEIRLRGKHFSLREGRNATEDFIKNEMTTVPAYQNRDLLEDLYHACDVRPPSREVCDQELMTWDHIREMKKSGMGIGSHTHSHRVLSTLHLNEQRFELQHSKTILERELGEPVISIGYPVGGYEHFNPETQSLALEAGYTLGFSYLTGVNHVGLLDPLDLRRIGPAKTPVELLASVAIPQIFSRRRCDAPQPIIYGEFPPQTKYLRTPSDSSSPTDLAS